MKANRLVLLAVAGTSLLALTGCSQTGNVAARIGDTTVTTSEVDFLTRVQCEALDKAAENPSQAGSAQMVARSQVRAGMINALIQSELDRQLAARDHVSYDKTTLQGVMQQYAQLVDETPAKDRTRFRGILEDIFRGQIQVYNLAQDQLAQQGVSSPTQDQVDQAVAKVQSDFRKTVDISVNPEYGADADGVAGSVDPSLSKAVSSFAKDARSAQPKSTWLAKLPADQRCG